MDVKINTQNVAIVSDDHLKQQYQKVTLLNILNFLKFIFSENFTILHKQQKESTVLDNFH